MPPCRAVGRAEGLVVDATAGRGGDAFLLAVSGLEVLAIERHPEVFAALEEGLRRAESDPKLARWLGGRLRLVHGDARVILPGLGDIAAVHVDPMFPPKRKTAAPKKDIQLLRSLVGEDRDAAELLAVARMAAPRVAVKRSRHAEALAPEPDAVIRGKLGRYDVYLRKGSGSISPGPKG